MTILDTPSAAAPLDVERFPTANLPKATTPLAGNELAVILQDGINKYIAATDLGGGSSQSVQTQNLHDLLISGNTVGVPQLVSSGTLTLAGGPNVTLSQAGNAVTISAAAGGGANFSAGVSNLGNTLGSTGLTGTQLVLAGGQSITLSQSTGPNGATVTISGASTAQSVQTQNLMDVTLAGNTAGVLALVSSGTLTLAGGNNVTLSQAGNAVTISGAAQTAGSNTFGMSNLGNTAGTSGVISGDSIRGLIVGGPNVTISQSLDAGNKSATLSVSVAAQTAESNTFGMSNIGNTAGTSGVISGNQLRMLVVGGPNVTASQSINGSSATVSLSVAAQSVQTQNLFALTISSNTAGAGALISSGTLTLAAGANITLSQNAGNAITIIGPSPSGGAFSAGVSNLGNTAGSTGVSGTQLVLVGTNGISLSQSTGAGGATVSINFTQSAESNTLGMSNLGNTAGTSGVISGNQLRMLVVGGPNVTVSQSINASSATLSVSVAAQTAESNTFGMSNLGNTAGTSGVISGNQLQMIVVGGPNVTVSQSINGSSATQSISVAAQSAESQSIGASNLGNTLGTSGVASGAQVRAVIIATSNLTISQSVNGASVTQSFIANAPFVGGVSTIGNTGGATGATSTRLIFVGSNNITLSQTTDASGGTISIFGGAGGAGFSAGVSTMGNTAGSTGVTGTRLVFVGNNAVGLNQSTDANGGTISISAPLQTIQTQNIFDLTLSGNTSGTMAQVNSGVLTLAGGNNITLSQSATNQITISGPNVLSAGISNLGNTSGTSGLASNRLVFVGTNGILLSQSSSGDSATISIGENITHSIFSPLAEAGNNGGTGNDSNGTMRFFYIPVERYYSASAALMAHSFTLGSTGTVTATISHALGIYTLNGSTLSALSLSGTNYTISYTSTQSTASYDGLRNVTMAFNMNLTPGDYWIGQWYRTSGGQFSVSHLLDNIPGAGWGNNSGIFGAASAASVHLVLGNGVHTASSTTLNSSVALSHIQGGRSNERVIHCLFYNVSA